MKKLQGPSPSMMEILRRYLERNCSNFIANVAKPERNTDKRFAVYVSFDAHGQANNASAERLNVMRVGDRPVM